MSAGERARTDGQRWDPDRYARNARFVADLGTPLIDLLDPGRHEDVLDLGCGDGALTAKLAPRCHSVLGVDASAEQVAAARRLGISAEVADGRALAFEARFDAILTNAALHWMDDPDAVIDGMWRALRPGGRVAGEMGGHGNIAAIRAALVDALARRSVDAGPLFPWYFPTAEAYRARLEARGFRVETIALIDRPTPLPGDVADWLETFAEPMLHAVPDADRPALVAELRESLRPALFDPATGWTADYVRLRFLARKPGAAAP